MAKKQTLIKTDPQPVKQPPKRRTMMPNRSVKDMLVGVAEGVKEVASSLLPKSKPDQAPDINGRHKGRTGDA